MNKKGFTIAETLVTFVLVAFIGLTLLQLLLNYKDLAAVKMKQQTYAAIKDQITAKIQNDVRRRGLLYITRESANSIKFVFADIPSKTATLTVHNITVGTYADIANKYIEYDGTRYPIPAGLPDETSSITDYSKYSSVNINMGNIYYESDPIKLSSSPAVYKTVYHVIVSVGVTDLDEDYGLDMVFVTDTEGSNYHLRNLISNSSFEGSDFLKLRDEANANFSDIWYTSYDTSTHTYSGETTCKGQSETTNPAVSWSNEYSQYDGTKALGCRCDAGNTCKVVLTQKVPVVAGHTYTLSYYYRTNYGEDKTITELGLTNICCKSSNDSCTTCGTDANANKILHAQGNFKEENRVVYTFTVPSGYNYVKLMFGIKAASDHAARVIVDAIQLEEGSTASLYQPS